MKKYYNFNDEKFFNFLNIKYYVHNQTKFLLKSILSYLKNNNTSYETFTPENSKNEIYINSYLYDFIKFIESIYIYDIDINFLYKNKFLKLDKK